MWITQPLKILENLRIFQTNGTVIQKFVAFLKLQKFLGNICPLDSYFVEKSRWVPLKLTFSQKKNWKALYETSAHMHEHLFSKTFDHSGLRTRGKSYSNLTFYIFVYNVPFSIRVEIINCRKKLTCELDHQRFFQRSVVLKELFQSTLAEKRSLFTKSFRKFRLERKKNTIFWVVKEQNFRGQRNV